MDVGVKIYKGPIFGYGLCNVAVAAEEGGFDSFWVPDHIAIPVEFGERYGYGPLIQTYDAEFPEAMMACAYVRR